MRTVQKTNIWTKGNTNHDEDEPLPDGVGDSRNAGGDDDGSDGHDGRERRRVLARTTASIGWP